MIAGGVVIDALPALDVDLDSPSMRDQVQQLIQAEMQTMEERDYLSRINGLLRNEELDAIVHRVEKLVEAMETRATPMSAPEAPPSALANDAQAWRNALACAQVAFLQQDAKLSRVEDMISAAGGVGSLFVPHNQALERDGEFYRTQVQSLAREVHEVQRTRQQLQQKALQQMAKLTARRNDSLVNRAHCELAFAALEQKLRARGVDFEEALRCREESRVRDYSDVSVDSTLRQYQAVHEAEVPDGTNSKRQRTQ